MNFNLNLYVNGVINYFSKKILNYYDSDYNYNKFLNPYNQKFLIGEIKNHTNTRSKIIKNLEIINQTPGGFLLNDEDEITFKILFFFNFEPNMIYNYLFKKNEIINFPIQIDKDFYKKNNFMIKAYIWDLNKKEDPPINVIQNLKSWGGPNFIFFYNKQIEFYHIWPEIINNNENWILYFLLSNGKSYFQIMKKNSFIDLTLKSDSIKEISLEQFLLVENFYKNGRLCITNFGETTKN